MELAAWSAASSLVLFRFVRSIYMYRGFINPSFRLNVLVSYLYLYFIVSFFKILVYILSISMELVACSAASGLVLFRFVRSIYMYRGFVNFSFRLNVVNNVFRTKLNFQGF